MSIVKPQKLGILAGPGSGFFTSRVLKHLRRLYLDRYNKLSASLVKRHNMSAQELLDVVILNDDLISKKIPRGRKPKSYTCPEFEIPVKYTRFANGEVKAEILQAVRGLRIFIIYDMSNNYPVKIAGSDEPISLSVNDHVMMLFTMINAALNSGCESVTLVLPTYPYARQHKKSGREALTAALFGRMVENMGVERIITLDIHSREIENCFNSTHLENIHASYQALIKLHKIIDFNDPNLVVVSPDTGAVERNRFYAEALHKPLAMLYKERDYSIVSKDAKRSNIRSISLLGDVKGKTVLMADDMIGTGGTLLIAMRELKNFGAKKIICLVSLPFFNGNAREEFEQAYQEGIFGRIVGTNAVFHDKTLTDREWFVQADVTELFARVISRLHHGRALSPVLDNRMFIQRLVDITQGQQSAPSPRS